MIAMKEETGNKDPVLKLALGIGKIAIILSDIPVTR